MPFIGNSLAPALMDIKRSTSIAGAINFVEADYSEANGLTGNGSTKYLNVGYNTSGFPVTTHLSFYQRTDALQVSTRILVGAAGAADDWWLGSTNPFLHADGRLGASVSVSQTGQMVKGFYYVERQSATDLKLYRNGAQIATTATNTAHNPPAQNFYAWAWNLNGSVAGYTDVTGSFLSIGLAMTAQQRTDFAAIVQTLQTNLGRAV